MEDQQQSLERLATKFEALKMRNAELRDYPQWAEYLELRKQGHFPLPPIFNNVSEATLRSHHAEQIALDSRVPPSLRQPTLEQERLRLGYAERYLLACMLLLVPKMPLAATSDCPTYPELAADVAALRAHRRKHPLPAIPRSDDDRRLLQLFLTRGVSNGWEQ